MPAAVIATIVVLMAVTGIDVLAGVSSALSLFGIRWAQSDGKDIVIPLYTETVLRIGFWHNAVWVILRLVIAVAVSNGSRVARIAGIVCEALAIVIWVPVLFVWLEGRPWLIEWFDFDIERGLAATCILGSAAVIVLLSRPTARTWCDRR